MLASWQSIARVNRNDFIPTVAKRRPQVRDLLDAFNDTGSFICSMSGSGSAVFGVYEALPAETALGAFEGTTMIPTRTADKVVQPIRIG
jgi:4-diphosphocytidyl-2C-methyl-D-erythritol kinase